MAIFRVEWKGAGLAHLVMDDPARKVNVIGQAALADLESALAEIERVLAQPGASGSLERAAHLTGVVLVSGKAGSFVAGADVAAIEAITDVDEAHQLIRRAHAAFGRLAALPCPTVAAIDGMCLGGGTELALACDSRVASEEPRTQIGLPEVLLGIFPGFGGSQRLPRLVGVSTALDLILTGRSLDARRAEKIGLIARAVPAAWLVERAHDRLEELRKRPPARRRDAWRPASFSARLIDGTPFGRALAFSRARAMTKKRTGGHYPAPLAAIETLERTQGVPLEQGLALEAAKVSALVVHPVCKNLVRIFRLSEQARRDPVADPSIRPQAVERLALVGAGVMGGGIAELTSRHGVAVRVRDLSPASITRAFQTVRSVVDERSRRRKGRDAARERDAQLARILPTLEMTGVGRADLAIEAVVEDLDVKRRVIAELEVRMRPDAVIATNTSSLSVGLLGEGLRHPGRFLGIHFFNPVHRMPLVEVVRGPKTSDEALVTAVAFARRLGKTPVVVEDAPGFLVNRVLMPYLREAMHLLEEGYRLVDIDAAMRRFGMPMGPFEVLDEVGLDVAQKAAGVLSRAFPDRMTDAPALEKLVAAGRLGTKSGRGFYVHRGKDRTPAPDLKGVLGLARERKADSLEPLTERMSLAMINEATRCLEEKVVPDAGRVDLGMIFGAGYPPFRGGVLRHADTLGLKLVESRLSALRAEHGERFKPAELISKLATAGERFTRTGAGAGGSGRGST